MVSAFDVVVPYNSHRLLVLVYHTHTYAASNHRSQNVYFPPLINSKTVLVNTKYIGGYSIKAKYLIYHLNYLSYSTRISYIYLRRVEPPIEKRLFSTVNKFQNCFSKSEKYQGIFYNSKTLNKSFKQFVLQHKVRYQNFKNIRYTLIL